MAIIIREFVKERAGHVILSSTCRLATDEEVQTAKEYRQRVDVLEAELQELKRTEARVQAELVRLRAGCPHEIQEEVPEYLYNYRYCAACGLGMGTV